MIDKKTLKDTGSAVYKGANYALTAVQIGQEIYELIREQRELEKYDPKRAFRRVANYATQQGVFSLAARSLGGPTGFVVATAAGEIMKRAGVDTTDVVWYIGEKSYSLGQSATSYVVGWWSGSWSDAKEKNPTSDQAPQVKDGTDRPPPSSPSL